MSRPDKYNKLKDSDKFKIIHLSISNNPSDIARITGFPRKTIADFLNRETNKKWWDKYDEGTAFITNTTLTTAVQPLSIGRNFMLSDIAGNAVKKFLRPSRQ